MKNKTFICKVTVLHCPSGLISSCFVVVVVVVVFCCMWGLWVVAVVRFHSTKVYRPYNFDRLFPDILLIHPSPKFWVTGCKIGQALTLADFHSSNHF